MENAKMTEQKKEQTEVSKKIFASRRKFLKKTAYVTPTLIVLGNLPKPVLASGGSGDNRDTNFGGFGGGPGGFGGG